MKLIGAGKLNRRIAVVREAAAVHDGYELVPGALQLLCWRFASVRAAARREQFIAGGIEARAELSAWVRFDSVTRTIMPTDRVVIDGRIHEIVAAPIEVGFRHAIELLLVAQDGGGAIDPDELDPVA